MQSSHCAPLAVQRNAALHKLRLETLLFKLANAKSPGKKPTGIFPSFQIHQVGSVELCFCDYHAANQGYFRR